MKTEEDEAFDELSRKQGMWGGGFQAKRRMAEDKLQEPIYKITVIDNDHPKGIPFEDWVQPAQEREWVGLTDEETQAYWDWEDWQTGAGRSTIFEMVRDIEAKLRSKNT
jgi:hypothetical protein